MKYYLNNKILVTFPIYSGIGITGLKLYKVVKVCNKEIDQLTNLKNEDLQSDECSTILKILISPGVTNIQKWPFNFFKTDLLIKVFTYLYLSNYIILQHRERCYKYLLLNRKN